MIKFERQFVTFVHEAGPGGRKGIVASPHRESFDGGRTPFVKPGEEKPWGCKSAPRNRVRNALRPSLSLTGLYHHYGLTHAGARAA